MKGMSLYIEYILLIAISSILFSLAFTWYNENKIYAINLINKNNFDIFANYISDLYKNYEGYYYYNKKIDLKNYLAHCLDRYTLISSGEFCTSTGSDFSYTGLLIEVNKIPYLYDIKTRLYYPLEDIGGIYKGCFNNNYVILIPTDNCTNICSGKCILELEKNGSIIISIIK